MPNAKLDADLSHAFRSRSLILHVRGADQLVSLILTKEMLLVAKKPSYKTLYTLKYAGGIKAFPVPKDQNGVIVISSELSEPLVFGCGQVRP